MTIDIGERLRSPASFFRDTRRQALSITAIALLAMALGYGAVAAPMVLLGTGAAAVLVFLSLAIPGALPKVFLGLMAILLTGYAFFGKAFAYAGWPPVYPGEVALGIGLCAAITCRRQGALGHPLVWLTILFMAWGAARTLPYLREYDLLALRDAVTWGYAAFALLISYFLHRSGLIPLVAMKWGVALRVFILWAPAAVLITRIYESKMPTVLGTDVPILSLKPGDAAVHLAGAAAFLLLHPDSSEHTSRRRRSPREWLWWGVWCFGVLVVASVSRGGFLAVALGIAAVAWLRPMEVGKRLSRVIIVGSLVILAFVALDVSIDFGGGRRLAPQQVLLNVASITQEESVAALEGSRRWRLMWWTEIVDYTFRGQYFWTGKGFGVNLANADGFQVSADQSLRSPHNATVTILARAGVPGLVLWLTLQLGFALAILLGARRARLQRQDWWVRLYAWILAYWIAFMVNGAFDVYLEGPQGGIWFWSLFGFGIAALQAQRMGVADRQLNLGSLRV